MKNGQVWSLMNARDFPPMGMPGFYNFVRILFFVF
jgi:hypothetical protein